MTGVMGKLITAGGIGAVAGAATTRLADKKQLNERDELISTQQMQVEQERRRGDILEEQNRMMENRLYYLEKKIDEILADRKGGKK